MADLIYELTLLLGRVSAQIEAMREEQKEFKVDFLALSARVESIAERMEPVGRIVEKQQVELVGIGDKIGKFEIFRQRWAAAVTLASLSISLILWGIWYIAGILIPFTADWIWQRVVK